MSFRLSLIALVSLQLLLVAAQIEDGMQGQFDDQMDAEQQDGEQQMFSERQQPPPLNQVNQSGAGAFSGLDPSIPRQENTARTFSGVASYMRNYFSGSKKADETKESESGTKQAADGSASGSVYDSGAKKTEQQITNYIPAYESADYAQNEARQSSFFSGLGRMNPLAGGDLFKPISMPTFPKLPDLTASMKPQQPPVVPTLPPPAPKPKTSIIGGGSGPMALTNDNVVVVNVLSSN